MTTMSDASPSRRRPRRRGEGTVHQRKPGLWEAKLPPDDQGRRATQYFTREKNALDWIHEQLRLRDDGILTGPDVSRMTVRDYLLEWLRNIEGTIAPRTHIRYEQQIRLNLLPVLGRGQLAKLTPFMVVSAYAHLRRDGRSDRTLGLAHATLHKALHDAVRWRILRHNPAHDCRPTHGTHRREARIWTVEEIQRFTHALEGTRWKALYVLAFLCGLRRGELCGLRWKDIDEDRHVLTVRTNVVRLRGTIQEGPPKSESSRRAILLPTPVIEELTAHRLIVDRMRADAGPAWREHDLVFPHPTGTLMNPDRANDNFRRTMTQLALPPSRLHDLRHSFATLLAELGVQPKTHQKLMGHATLSVTMLIYEQVTSPMERQAADLLGSVWERGNGSVVDQSYEGERDRS